MENPKQANFHYLGHGYIECLSYHGTFSVETCRTMRAKYTNFCGECRGPNEKDLQEAKEPGPPAGDPGKEKEKTAPAEAPQPGPGILADLLDLKQIKHPELALVASEVLKLGLYLLAESMEG